MSLFLTLGVLVGGVILASIIEAYASYECDCGTEWKRKDGKRCPKCGTQWNP
jgi:hypothetical protein